MNYYNQQEQPDLTFISSQEQLSEPIEYKHLTSPYLLLKYRPKCDCGKEFRSSGKERAEQNIAKHLSHKKYANCKPIIEELKYNIPEFVTIRQIFGTESNRTRNDEIRKRMESSSQYEYPEIYVGYQIKQGINIEVVVIRKSPIRTVNSKKTGEQLRVCDITIKDENQDTIPMTLWNGLCDKVKLDDHLIIRNAFVKDGQEYHQGYGYSQRTELGVYKNASTIEVVQN